MHIWILTNDYRPAYGFGLASYIEQAGRMFVLGGHKVTIFVRDIEKNIIEEKIPGLRVIRFHDTAKDYEPSLDYYVANSKQIAKVVLNQIDLDGQKPDIIEVQDCMALGYYLLQNKWQGDKRLKNIPITIMMHTPRFELLSANKENIHIFNDYLIGQLEKNCFLAADGLLCPSNFLKNRLQPYVSNKEIQVIPLPFELNSAEMPALTSKKNIDILYAGGLEHRKGIMSFMEAAAKAWQEGIEFNCQIIGKPYWFEEKKCTVNEYLQDKYHKYILDQKLKLIGIMPTDILYSILNQAKIIIIPSHYDNFPVSCLEAMALGKPMLVSKQGGQAEMVGEDESCGLIFDWEKPEDAQKQLKKILSFETKKLEAMGQNAREKIQGSYNYRTILAQREEYYAKLINSQIPARSYPIENPFPRQQIKKLGSTNGLLSIIMAVHNPGVNFLESLRSALASDYNPKEVIIVNASSQIPFSLTQLEIIKNENFPMLQIIDSDTESLSESRNLGAKAARGEYLTFLDDNEAISNNYYTKALDLLKSYNNIDYVYSWQRFYEGLDKLHPTFNTEFPLLIYKNIVGSTAVIRRNVYLEHGIQDQQFEYGLEEHELWLRLYAAGFSGICLSEEMSFYRVTKDSLFWKSLQNVNQQNALAEKMIKKHKNIFEKYSTELISLYLANGIYDLTLH